jgi:5-methyltetrahydrofolate--homocysteine methyltransferase
VWVKDASRAVGVAQSLISAELRANFVAANEADYADIRARHAQKGNGKRLVSLEHARGQRFQGGWADYVPPTPPRPGITEFKDVSLQALLPYIDWTPFFNAWELAGRYPAILTDEVVGSQASELFADAQTMLKQIIDERWITANGVVGLWRAHSVGDDIEVFNEHGGELAVIHGLRQQVDKPAERPDFCLSDFIAPHDSGREDWFGAFAVTAGLGCEERARAFELANDDYSAILLKSLADRFAEAMAEYLHERVRKELWAYAADERLDNEALVREQYRGIRPAPGYPACPDHTTKRSLFRLLDAPGRCGMALTESLAMTPAASVCGMYFSHPQSQYFVVGRIGKEQVADYAHRRGLPMHEAERWLAPVLDYDPE